MRRNKPHIVAAMLQPAAPRWPGAHSLPQPPKHQRTRPLVWHVCQPTCLTATHLCTVTQVRTLSVRLGEGSVFRICVALLAAAYVWAMGASLVLPGERGCMVHGGLAGREGLRRAPPQSPAKGVRASDY